MNKNMKYFISMPNARVRNAWVRMLGLLICVCFSFPTQAGLFGSDCPEAENSRTPEWVKAPLKYRETGYRLGFGQASFNDDKKLRDLVGEAEANARADLASSINVKVESEKTIDSALTHGSRAEESHSRFVSQVRTTSKIDLPGVRAYRQWQDPDSCRVHVMVRLKESVIGLLLQKNLADNFLERAKNTDLTTGERLLSIDEAIFLAQTYEFGALPGNKSSAQSLRLYANIRKDLQQQQRRHNNVVIVVNKTAQPGVHSLGPITKTLKSLQGSFNLAKDCNSATLCLRHANSTSANYASIAEISFKDVNRLNGFWQGMFSVDLSLFDLQNNHELFVRKNLKVRVMHRHEYGLTVDRAMAKWMSVHKDKLDAFRQVANELNSK